MKTFVEGLHHPKSLLCYHTYSELFLRPWSYGSADPPGEAVLEYLVQDTIARIAAVHGHTYGETISYHAFGEATDYFWNGLRLASFTPEMRPAAGGIGGFDPPVSQIVPNNQENLPAAIQLVKDAGLRKVWIKDHAADAGTEPSAVWTGTNWTHAFWTSPEYLDRRCRTCRRLDRRSSRARPQHDRLRVVRMQAAGVLHRSARRAGIPGPVLGFDRRIERLDDSSG